MECPYCGKTAPAENAKFCAGCGRRFAPAPAPTQPAAQEFEMPAPQAVAPRKTATPGVPRAAIAGGAVLILAVALFMGFTLSRQRLNSLLKERESVIGTHEHELERLVRENKNLFDENASFREQLETYGVVPGKQKRLRMPYQLIYKDSQKAKTKYYDVEMVGELEIDITKTIDNSWAPVRALLVRRLGFPDGAGERVRVKIFAARADYDEYNRLLAGKKPPAGGAYDRMLNEISIPAEGLDEPDIIRAVVRETTRQTIYERVTNPPVWLHEGLAEYCSAGLNEDYTSSLGKYPSQALSTLKLARTGDMIIPFADFIMMKRADLDKAVNESRTTVPAARAQAHVTTYLLLNSTKSNRSLMSEYVKALLKDESETLGGMAGKKRIEALDMEWNAFLEQL